MGFKNAIENYRENGLKYFTPKRAWLFIRSLLRKITGKRLKEKDMIEWSEVITYKSLTCPDCVAQGKCRVCKCPVNELFTAMDVGCSDHKFPAFKDSTNWTFVWQNIKKGKVKPAVKEITRKKKSWKEGWREYKEKEEVIIHKMYG